MRVTHSRSSPPCILSFRFNIILLFVLLLLPFSQMLTVNGKTYFITDGESSEDGEENKDNNGPTEDEFGNQHVILPLNDDSVVQDESQGVSANPKNDLLADSKLEQPLQSWNEFGNDIEEYFGQELDPGSWQSVIDSPVDLSIPEETMNASQLYSLGVHRMFGLKSLQKNISLAAKLFQIAADQGHPHAQSALAFLHVNGYSKPMNQVKGFLYHTFGSSGGSFQSTMALAYSFLRQQEYEQAANLYAKVATKTVVTNHILGEAPIVEDVRLNKGGEENEEAVKGHGGENDDNIQYVVYKAKYDLLYMKTLGSLYYTGSRGLSRNHATAFFYFSKAAEAGDGSSMASLGEMYTRGVGVQRNYQKALYWFNKSATIMKDKDSSGYNGMGYLHARGFGVQQNFTRAAEYFAVAAKRENADGLYYLGVMLLQGLGVRKNVHEALANFKRAALQHHLAAAYQLARMEHKGIGTKPDFLKATILYKAVAERGPWGALLRWAHTNYLTRDYPTSLLLYSRAAELGYEVAQSNAAWLLDKFQKGSGCVGGSGRRCKDNERHERSHRLWRHASEQGNVQASLLIGDAYFYGRGTKKDLERAVEAYRRASDYRNAQAMFNLGFMYEHGLGLPSDEHLAKRWYDSSLETDKRAALAVKLALLGLWLRNHHKETFVVKLIDTLPEIIPKTIQWAKLAVQDEGNLIVATLFAILLGVLHLRQRQRRPRAVPIVEAPGM